MGHGSQERSEALRAARQARVGGPQRLFGNQRGTSHVDPGMVRKAFHEACIEAGVQDKATPHCLRHLLPARLMEEGVPAETVRILLGRASITTTQAYLHLTEPARRKLNDTAAGFWVPLFD